ncbi:MAG TPA: GGDEF domain-containing protein [Bradyrhizobium sp.]|jgi:diguanylate cyclase|nr:GGDEF domain-containing protein [Bradyrhizobium sp.]
MSSAASLLQGRASDSAVARATGLPSDLLRRRVGQRRQMLIVQAVSCSLITSVLSIYCYAGTVSIVIPSVYFLTGIGLIGFFVVLSEAHVNDRFEDHYLTIFQVGGHVALQLTFLLAAPEIGYAFLSVLFLIFGFGALRMTSRQATIAWTLTTMGLAPIFLLTNTPIGMPVATDIERFAAMLCYILTIGQCAFVGLYGSSLRKMLYNRSFELKEANRRIEELAELDELTGSLNRRCIMRMLDEEVSRARRTKTPCSIALIDLDWFKRINDTYGHPTGDEVLRTFAITVFANIRNFDRFGRFGGEEFMLVLPDTPRDAALRILDRLRAIVADLDWSAFSPGMRVTVSAGIATLQPNDTPDTVLARADGALYEAKAQGRNRIVSARSDHHFFGDGEAVAG